MVSSVPKQRSVKVLYVGKEILFSLVQLLTLTLLILVCATLEEWKGKMVEICTSITLEHKGRKSSLNRNESKSVWKERSEVSVS